MKIIKKPANNEGQDAAMVGKVNWACGHCRLVPSESECSSEKLQRLIPRAHVCTPFLAFSNEFQCTRSAPMSFLQGSTSVTDAACRFQA